MKYLTISRIFFLAGAVGALSAQTFGPVPARTLGHLKTGQINSNPNLVEGRELYEPQGVAIDTGSGTPIVWVADFRNNRVLGWRNASAFENGAMADVVLGQRDFQSTSALGPGTTFSSGLRGPMAVAADAEGNVFVADAGNNRILRFRRPFDQPDAVKTADFVIGQPNLNGRNPNQGGLSERSLFLANAAASQIFRAGMIFDAQGNLWISDAGNHRILRYPASALGADAPSNPAANLALGQPTFTTANTLAANGPNRANKTAIRNPSGIAIDQGGRLYVADALSRVLVYRPPFVIGMEPARIAGLTPPPPQGQTPPAPINEYSIGVIVNSQLVPAEGVFTIGNNLFVVDSPANRILRFDPFDQWPDETRSFSPRANAVIGQDTFTQTSTQPNRALAEPNANSFLNPVGGAFGAGETFIVDAGNNRVLALGDISTGPPLTTGPPYSARRVLGQIGPEYRGPNMIDGREFFFLTGAAIAVDRGSNPPRLYVADPGNQRVLGFSDVRKAKQGDRADIVIGQQDFFRSVVNFPANSLDARSDSSLALPIGLAVDRDGNLWVADSGNGRVLRFPSPFQQANQRLPRADLVIGQSSFTSRVTDASQRNLLRPYGLAFTSAGSLLVSDAGHNRILLFNGPFSTGMQAAAVIGQPDFTSVLTGTGTATNPAPDNRFNAPLHIALDSDDRLYVTDSGNNRVLIFSQVSGLGPDPRSVLSLSRNVRTPASVAVNQQTGDIWVANAAGNNVFRYPQFDALASRGDNADTTIPVGGPIAITLDNFGNPLIADSLHRIGAHFPVVGGVNGASYFPRLAPGMWTTLRSTGLGYRFADDQYLASESPIPKELGDVAITVDDVPAPVYYVSPEQINFLMPMRAPTSGSAAVQLTQPSTGRVIAYANLAMSPASPGLFTSGGTGTGQIAALNQDGSLNGAAAPTLRGQVVQLFGTGPGFVPNSPDDGAPATGAVSTEDVPRVILGGREIEASQILYSGLAPGLAGVWQINFRVPDTAAPGNSRVIVSVKGIVSNNPANVNTIFTTIAVR